MYVDDIVITDSSSQEVNYVVQQLQDHFALKDLGQLNYFLGISIQHTSTGIHLSLEKKNATNLLKRVHMHDAKPLPTSMASSTVLSAHQGSPFADPSLYMSTVGALQYMTISRPNLIFSVNKVCQFMSSPLDTHWKAVKRILRCICGILMHGIHFSKASEVSLTAYYDADWPSYMNDRRSTSGLCIFLGSNSVSWSNKKKPTVSRSFTEAKYRSIANAIAECAWFESLLKELRVTLPQPPVIWSDNLSAISISSNPVLYA